MDEELEIKCCEECPFLYQGREYVDWHDFSQGTEEITQCRHTTGGNFDVENTSKIHPECPAAKRTILLYKENDMTEENSDYIRVRTEDETPLHTGVVPLDFQAKINFSPPVYVCEVHGDITEIQSMFQTSNPDNNITLCTLCLFDYIRSVMPEVKLKEGETECVENK